MAKSVKYFMFIGQYEHTIDVKGRITIPNKFRNLLGDSFLLTRSLDGCLSIYDKNSWEQLEKKLNELPYTDEKARLLKRFTLGSSDMCEPDKQGRVLIPQALRKNANLLQDVVFVGVGDHIEIWDKKMWDTNNDFNDYEKLSKDMEGLGI